MEIETVLKVLANLLRDLAARIDAGNSNLTEEEAIELVSVIGHYTNREESTDESDSTSGGYPQPME